MKTLPTLLLLMLSTTAFAQDYRCAAFVTNDTGGHYSELETCGRQGRTIPKGAEMNVSYQVPQDDIQISTLSGDRNFSGTFNYSCQDGMSVGTTDPLVRIGPTGNAYLFRTTAHCDAAFGLRLVANQFTSITKIAGLDTWEGPDPTPLMMHFQVTERRASRYRYDVDCSDQAGVDRVELWTKDHPGDWRLQGEFKRGLAGGHDYYRWQTLPLTDDPVEGFFAAGFYPLFDKVMAVCYGDDGQVSEMTLRPTQDVVDWRHRP